MSHDLPAVPNLQHLRKQAKKRLRDLQRQDPDSRLADAQRALAREYGFASWETLKAHVEEERRQGVPGDRAQPAGGGNRGDDGQHTAAATAEPPSEPLFPRFTFRARQALFFARYEAAESGRRFIGPRDVLLGVIRAAGGALHDAFARGGVGLEEARTALSDEEHGAPIGTGIEIPFRGEAVETFRAAAAEADRLGHRDIRLPHIVLALGRRPDAVGAFLESSGLSAEQLQQVAETSEADDRLP